jgi:FtsP/CotA-like multicopper oxidase with cupredoxin domain
MRPGPALLLLAVVRIATGTTPLPAQLPVAMPNDNRTAAGVLRDGVLHVELQAVRALWHPDGDSLPGVAVDAFAEPGKAPQVSGPLLRMPVGAELRLTVRNSLARDTLTFRLPPGFASAGGAAAAEAAVIPPGETRELRARPGASGNHAYHATTSRRISRATGFGWLLSGGVVVDPPDGPVPDDRVFVIQVATDSVVPAGFAEPAASLFAINGRSWPHTERCRPPPATPCAGR